MKRMVLVLVSVLLTGCATLNQSECRHADWRMIGMEDGAQGYPMSYIGKHRSACAKYGVTPDMEDYRLGHEEGVRQFCTPQRGFEMGQNGRVYDHVCPPDVEEEFLESYNLGREWRQRQSELDRTANAIQSGRKEISTLQEEIKEKKQRLISDQSTAQQRSDLLEEIEQLQDKVKSLEKEHYRNKRSYEEQKAEFEALRTQAGF